MTVGLHVEEAWKGAVLRYVDARFSTVTKAAYTVLTLSSSFPCVYVSGPLRWAWWAYSVVLVK